MLTIYVNPKKRDQVFELSDREHGYLAVAMADQTTRYTFMFVGHAHPNFWHDGPLSDGMAVNVCSIDGPQRYEIRFR